MWCGRARACDTPCARLNLAHSVRHGRARAQQHAENWPDCLAECLLALLDYLRCIVVNRSRAPQLQARKTTQSARWCLALRYAVHCAHEQDHTSQCLTGNHHNTYCTCRRAGGRFVCSMHLVDNSVLPAPLWTTHLPCAPGSTSTACTLAHQCMAQAGACAVRVWRSWHVRR